MKKLLLLAALLAAGAAGAQDKGFYAAAHLGQSDAKETCDGVSGTGVSCDKTGTAWKVLGGYQFNKNFAAELGFADLGDFKASGPGGSVRVSPTAFDLVGLGMLPVFDRLSVYGKLGMYRASTKGNAETSTLRANSTENNVDVTFGFGVRYDISTRFAVRGEWQRYQKVGGSEIGEDDVDVLSAGVLFRF